MANENDNNQPAGSEEATEGPKTVTLTEEQLDQLISKRVNQAISAHMKRQKDQPQQQEKAPVQDETLTLKARIKKLEDEKAEEKRQLLAAKREGAIRSALSSAQAANVEGAIALLERKGKIVQMDDGSVYFRKGTQNFEGTEIPDDVPLEEGIRSWLSGEEGSWYAQPRNASGSGFRQGQRGSTQTAPANEKERRRLQQAEELNALFGKG